MFIDQATIRVKAGDGGHGCVAFRREKFVPRGGPSGGDGGAGGSVYVAVSARLNTLYHLQFRRDWRAGRLYVPRDVQGASGADESQLTSGGITDAWALALERCVSFTRDRFAAGRAVCDRVGGRLRLELRFTWLGGMRILDRAERDRRRLVAAEIMRGVYFEMLLRIERSGFDVFTERAHVPRPKQALIALRQWLCA